MSLFESLVSTIPVYCSEVWGPSLLRSCSTPKKCLDADMHRPLFTFLRSLCGKFCRSTSHELLLHEFEAKLPARAWLRASVRLWNRVSALPADDPLAQAMRENIAMVHRPPQLWLVDFESFLGISMPCQRVVCKLSKAWCSWTWVRCCWPFMTGSHKVMLICHLTPGTPILNRSSFARMSSGLLLMTLIATMVDGCWCALPDYVSHTAGIPSQHVGSLAAFRLGAHHYEVATGRWTTNTPRSDRVCKLCCQGVAEGRLGSVGPTLLVTSFMLFLSVVSKKCLAVCMLLFLSVLFCKSL